MQPQKKIFVYKQINRTLSLELLYLADMFINKPKTELSVFLYRLVSNTGIINNSFRRNVPTRAKKTPSSDF